MGGFLHPHLPASGNDRGGGGCSPQTPEAGPVCLYPPCTSTLSLAPWGPGCLPLGLHLWEGAVFSSRLKVVERGCTGSSQRVTVGGAQFLSHRGNCGPSGPRVA